MAERSFEDRINDGAAAARALLGQSAEPEASEHAQGAREARELLGQAAASGGGTEGAADKPADAAPADEFAIGAAEARRLLAKS